MKVTAFSGECYEQGRDKRGLNFWFVILCYFGKDLTDPKFKKTPCYIMFPETHGTTSIQKLLV